MSRISIILGPLLLLAGCHSGLPLDDLTPEGPLKAELQAQRFSSNFVITLSEDAHVAVFRRTPGGRLLVAYPTPDAPSGGQLEAGRHTTPSRSRIGEQDLYLAHSRGAHTPMYEPTTPRKRHRTDPLATEYILVASKRPLDLEAVRSRDPASAGSAVYSLETGWSARGAFYSTDAVEAIQLLLEDIIHPDTEHWAIAQDAVR